MKRIYLIIAILVAATYQQTNAQGCVAIKGIGGICNRPSEGGSWYLDINNRYFKSYKHFVGKEEQKQREEEGSNVINHLVLVISVLQLIAGCLIQRPLTKEIFKWVLD
jgi:hypothetical protein